MIQNFDAAGLTAIYFANFFFLFFFSSTTAVSTSGQEEKSRAVQKGPIVLILLETCVSSPVSIGACCFKVRLLHGMLSALIHYPGHALSQLECKICFSGVARRLCQHLRVYDLALQLMFFGRNSPVLFHNDLVVIPGKIIIFHVERCCSMLS